MSYTKSEYPDSMKNLQPVVRMKAIDIVNAMLKEGYEEKQAIPISIAQAKDWAKEATEKEIAELSNKDITEHEKKTNSARLQDSDVQVSYNQEKEMWSVKSVGAKQVDSYHATKKEAVSRAEEIAENKHTKVIKENKED